LRSDIESVNLKIVVLDGQTLGDDLDLSLLESYGELQVYSSTKEGQVLKRCQGAEIVISNKVPLNRNTIAELKSLQMIQVAATGYNNVDLEAASECGVAVCNVSGYSTNSVAEHTFALYFGLQRQLLAAQEYSLSKWQESPVFCEVPFSFEELSHSVWGILGMGNIGKRVAQLASGFGARVIHYSVSDPDSSEYSWEEFLAKVDVLSIHCKLSEKTNSLLDDRALSWMKDHAMVLNLARGEIINEAAMISQLKSDRLYFGLDVLSEEPPFESGRGLSAGIVSLRDCPRFQLTPHMAWNSLSSRRSLLSKMCENIQSFLEGGSLNRVD